jgi:hypothetical protein
VKVFEVAKLCAVVMNNVREPPVYLVLVVLGAQVECRSRFGHCPKPIAREHVRAAQLEKNDGLSGGALAGEERRLPQRYAFGHGPESRRYWLVVPFRHVDEVELCFRRLRFLLPWRSSWLRQSSRARAGESFLDFVVIEAGYLRRGRKPVVDFTLA